MMKTPRTKPVCLFILDGWGSPEAIENPDFNAITQAQTPNWDKLWQTQPHVLLDASGKIVGLPDGQMGNSEVGHLTIGSGRIIPQDLTRITHDIAQNTFTKQPVVQDLLNRLMNCQQEALLTVH
jgi:2,3-bisphosphoglycerate-independent phosphoglycerate mutase